MSAAYDFVCALALPVVVARLVWRGFREPKYWQRWVERFAYYDGICPGPIVWVHAVSVGEVAAAAPIVRALRARRDAPRVLITTTTPTGSDAVLRQFGDTVLHAYSPYDLGAVVQRFLRHFRPRLLILMETELWPNLLGACADRGIPVVLANARLSERSARRYHLFARTTRKMLASISAFAAQSEADAGRFIGLGARPGTVSVTGSLKFDVELPPSVHEQAQAVRRMLGANRRIMMAGSTRDGEDEILLTAFLSIREEFPDALLVIAPRHPERFRLVAEMFRRRNLRLAERSSAESVDAATDVYLVNTMGELPLFYAASDLAFVGGSLTPAGGHNVLEPASLGVPVLVGPYTENFAAICALLEERSALRRVGGADELARAVSEWFADSNGRDAAGAAGRRAVEEHRGALHKVMWIVAHYLDT